MQLPETWEALDPTEVSLEEVAEFARDFNPELAAAIEEGATSPDLFQLFASDTERAGTNLTVGREEFLFPITVSDIIATAEDQFAAMGVSVIATDATLTIGGLRAGSIQYSHTFGTDLPQFRGVSYIILSEPNVQFYLDHVTTADEFDALEPIFEQISQSFRVLEAS